jgi:hypothetical protein
MMRTEKGFENLRHILLVSRPKEERKAPASVR